MTLGIGQQLGLAGSLLPSLHTGKPRFIHDLFAKVIFPEAPLAASTARPRGAWPGGNEALCRGAGQCAGNGRPLGQRLLGQPGSPRASAADCRQPAAAREQLDAHDDIHRLLEVLDISHAATQVFPDSSEVPLVQRGGLYQRSQAEPVVTDNYRRDLERLLLPRCASFWKHSWCSGQTAMPCWPACAPT